MKLKVGDKVKFLNQVGGGVVSKVVSSQIVNVTDSTGFDIPTLIKDLIKVEPLEGAGKLFEQDVETAIPTEHYRQPQPSAKEYTENISSLRPVPESRNIDQGLYLAFVPHEQRWLITGDMDVYIINRTPHTVLVNAFLQADNEFEGVDYSDIPAESKMYLSTIDRDSIAAWSKGVIQALFHYNKGSAVLSPVSADFKIKGSRFYKEESYVSTACIDSKAIVVSLSKLSDIRTVATIDAKAKFVADKDEQPQAYTAVKKAKIMNPDNILEQYFIEPNVAEVDLHIEAIYPNCKELDDHSKFEIQMNFFSKCLNDAIVNHVQKVIFIHGVGSGILKNEIVKELKKYKGLHYFDASMAKYGVGATEVYFSQNIEIL
ncbi:MAG: DUF2027 domain-containing protein [Bacteroidales bacterium]|nr:DUF2027 domain-containing protein [Bacteroidales bacterium]